MKRIYGLSLLAAFAAAPAALHAQTPAPQAQERAVHGHAFSGLLAQRAELGLTDDQVARIEAIGLRLQAQIAPLSAQIRASAGHAREGAQREQMRARMESMTPEQREQMRARMEQRRDSVQNLTPEQRAGMRERMRDSGARGERGVRGQRGGMAARAVPEEMQVVMEQIRTHTQAARQEVMAVLTAEQQTRLRERHGAEERMNRRPAAR
jgi:Spy/CpxP family protein refolding chaperone